MSAFIIVFSGKLETSINGSKLVLNLSLFFQKSVVLTFFYKAGLSSINVWLITGYANLTSTYPLLGFLKQLECLEVGFREVVRGLVSPTPFMEGCVMDDHKFTHGYCPGPTQYSFDFYTYKSSFFKALAVFSETNCTSPILHVSLVRRQM